MPDKVPAINFIRGLYCFPRYPLAIVKYIQKNIVIEFFPYEIQNPRRMRSDDYQDRSDFNLKRSRTQTLTCTHHMDEGYIMRLTKATKDLVPNWQGGGQV
jgi:hypothetical protein